MNIALVEDSKADTAQLLQLLSDFEEQRQTTLTIDCFTNGNDFLEQFEKYKYSIVFLDIFMEKLNGIETAKQIREKDHHCMLIFMSSSDGFMPQAFSCHAFEYIQKPVSWERILQILTDALRILPQTSQVLKFTCHRQTIHMLYSDIVCIVARGHNTDISDCYGMTHSPYISFSKFTKPLTADNRFLPINKGILVNMEHILKFENKTCLLTGNISLPVRVRAYAHIEQLWLDYTFAQIHARLFEGGNRS